MVFPHEVNLYHYFKNPVDPKKYLDWTEKISELHNISEHGWKKFSLYYDYLVKASKFQYCVKLFCVRESQHKTLTWKLFKLIMT